MSGHVRAPKTFPTGKVILRVGVLAIVGGILLKNVLAPGDKVRIERMIRSLAKAVENHDTKTLVDALDHDFVLEDDLGRTYPYEEVLAFIRSYRLYYRNISVRFGTMEVDVFPTRAAARFSTTTRWHASYGGAGVHNGEWQAEFIRQGRDWKLVKFKVLGEGF
ncbi:MAG: DUF4440 domain-containing protein [Planctomycetota bacterium]